VNAVPERDSWDTAARARVSDRWAKAAVGWNQAMTDALLTVAAITPDSVVLDLAAGSGEPSLTIAERLMAGRIMALDRSIGGLSLANTVARRLGLDSKIACIQADGHAIPLERNCLDRVTCRCGIMFFSDTRLVLSEMMRVLRPGGRVALLAWGRFEQPFFQATVGVVLRLVEGAQMPAAARTMFRFAVPGSLEGRLREAGFCEVHEQLLSVPRVWAGTPEQLWAYQQEVSTLCQPLFESIPPEVRAQVDAEVVASLARFRGGSVLTVPVDVIVVSGQRP
jgi:ubiquinone/menaquinone biosynthesis C-methylase UbiE